MPEVSEMSQQSKELEEIRQLIRGSGLEEKVFLEKEFAPLNARIAAVRGQLIVTHTRLYEPMTYSSDPRDESRLILTERIQIGIITDKTRVSVETEDTLHFYNTLIFDVQTLYPKEKSSSKQIPAFYIPQGIFTLPVVYFRDRPPAAEGKVVFPLIKNKPRLKLYTGDAEAIPFLQSELKGYEYTALSRDSGRELPLNPELESKIRKEQLNAYNELKDALREYLLVGVKQFLSSSPVQKTIGESFLDEQIGTPKDILSSCLRKVQERNYDKDGRVISIDEDVGVRTEIDMKRYFSHMLEKYSFLVQQLKYSSHFKDK